jgi:hypothetical protein
MSEEPVPRQPPPCILAVVGPTVFRHGSFRFYFFSREEPRIHVHVSHPEGEAKYWLEPVIELAENHGLTRRQVTRALGLVEEHEDEIRRAWRTHFPG